ncbi:MAG TPA: LamG domain-containing protein, partial [Polyangiales bacterium]
AAGGGTSRFAITIGGNASGQEQQVNPPAVATGSWQHVVVTLTGNTATVYINGVQAGQNTSMTLNPTSLGATTQNWIGRSQYNDPYPTGKFDNFRIYDRALSATEVQNLFSGKL